LNRVQYQVEALFLEVPVGMKKKNQPSCFKVVRERRRWHILQSFHSWKSAENWDGADLWGLMLALMGFRVSALIGRLI
jgi:hypothetical protein